MNRREWLAAVAAMFVARKLVLPPPAPPEWFEDMTGRRYSYYRKAAPGTWFFIDTKCLERYVITDELPFVVPERRL